MINLEDYNFDLPAKFIAQQRVQPFTEAKLLVFEKGTKQIAHRRIGDLPEILTPNDVLVFNNSRVLPARIFGKKPTGGKVELLLVRERADRVWQVLARPGKSITVGLEIIFPGTNLVGKFLERGQRGEWLLEFNLVGAEFLEVLNSVGEMPTPPYIRQKLTRSEWGLYQTCYAQTAGSAAAPTAGLHFTPELLVALKKRGVQTEFVTLHVGLGTFAPLEERQLTTKKLHAERYEIGSETASRLNTAKKEGKRIVAVGTTSLRTLEAATVDGKLRAGARETDIFIQPGYDFKFADGVLTNFHLPKSSLLMLVAALVGREQILQIYEEAKRCDYRFFSFGDASLLI